MASVQDYRGEFPIVDPETGLASREFLRFLQERGVNVTDQEALINQAIQDAATAQSNVTALTAVVNALGLNDLTDVDVSTTPPTDGQALVYVDANSRWEPGDVAGGGGAPFGGVSLSIDTDITGANLTAGSVISFGAGSTIYDTDNAHDEVTNNSRITIPPGVTKVRLNATVYSINITGGNFLNLRFYKNGVLLDRPIMRQMISTDSVNQNWIQLNSPVLDCVAGDYFELYVATETDTSIDYRAAFSAEWVTQSAGNSPAIIRPVAADFSLHGSHEMTGAQVLDNGGVGDGNGIFFRAGVNTTTENYLSYTVPVTLNTPMTVTARFANAAQIVENWAGIGIFIGDSTDVQRGIIWGARNFTASTRYEMAPMAYANFSTNTGLPGGTTRQGTGRGFFQFSWFRFVYDGTDIHLDASLDGVSWMRYASYDRATTLIDIDRVGFGCYAVSVASGQNLQLWCDHFEITYP